LFGEHALDAGRRGLKRRGAPIDIKAFREGRRPAAGIAGARYVAREGRNRLLREGEPAGPRFLDGVRAFPRSPLSPAPTGG
jgi:hypothetical protein